jgi:hypothetical protein
MIALIGQEWLRFQLSPRAINAKSIATKPVARQARCDQAGLKSQLKRDGFFDRRQVTVIAAFGSGASALLTARSLRRSSAQQSLE